MTGPRTIDFMKTFFRVDLTGEIIFFVTTCQHHVTLVITSDFARTFTMNTGFGTNHVCRGNHFLMGGTVKGGVIHGRVVVVLFPLLVLSLC